MPWFVNVAITAQPVLVPDYMADTVARLRREGWAEVPDPRVVRETGAETDAQATIPAAVSVDYVDADPARTAAVQQEREVTAIKTVRKRNASAREWIGRKH